MSAGRDDSCDLRQAIAKRNVFERATGDHEVERVVREGKRQKISLSEADVASTARAFGNCFPGGANRSGRKIERGDDDWKTQRAQQRQREQAGAASRVENLCAARNGQRMVCKILIQRSSVAIELEC